MTIEVKSVRPPERESQDAGRFEFNATERLSRLPTYFALAVVAMAAYLRSIFAVEGRLHDETIPRLTDDDSPAPAGVGEAIIEAADADSPLGAQVDEAVPPSEDGSQLGNPWPGLFAVPDFPQMHFVAPTFYTTNVQPFVPVAVMRRPVNDNAGWGVGGSWIEPPPVVSVARLPVVMAPPDAEQSGNDGGTEDDDEDQSEADNSLPANRAPLTLGRFRLLDVFAGQAVVIGLSHLLNGATDPDGDALAISGLVVRGAEWEALGDGWLIDTDPGMLGPVTLNYRISDGQSWVVQTASFEITRMQHALTPLNDIHLGSPFDDDISAGVGHDLIDSRDGNDHVEGGHGDDHINGGSDDDVLAGGSGHDIIFGGAGHDVIWGGEGQDRLFGEDGDDIVDGGAGHDHVDGGNGDDILSGGMGNDRLLGGEGEDSLFGGDGADHLDGGAGADLLMGGDGADLLFGGDGEDVLIGGAGADIVIGDADSDVMDGGEGDDCLDFSKFDTDLFVDAVGGLSQSEETGRDRISGFETILGGSGDDMFIVGGKAMVLSGGDGDDRFIFEITDDMLSVSSNLMHRILDFVVGDRVRVRDHERPSDDTAQERFEAIYGDDDDLDWLESDVPVKVAHERIEDDDWTIVIADIDGDSTVDVTINIQGILLPVTDHV